MNPLTSLASILGLSVVSGVNLYLTVLALGLAERYHWIAGLPPDLQILAHPAVLTFSALLFLIEFLADKIPFVTVAWDGIHTFIRPVGGALLALGAAGHIHPALQVAAMLAGGTLALGSHGTKMGVRVLAHAAPEPGSHSLISLAEDIGVLGLLALVYAHPYVALPVLAAIILTLLALLPLLARVLHFLLAALKGRFRAWVGGTGHPAIPLWADLAILACDPSGGQPVLRAFARQVKGVARLKDGYLTHAAGRWVFVHRGLFRTRTLLLDEAGPEPLRLNRGAMWDAVVVLRDRKPQVFFITKEGASWSPLGTPPRSPQSAATNGTFP